MPKEKPIRGTVSVIEWMDHCAHGDKWDDLEDAQKEGPLRTVTCGFVIRETKEILTVAASMSEQNMVADYTVLIKKNVVRRTDYRTRIRW